MNEDMLRTLKELLDEQKKTNLLLQGIGNELRRIRELTAQ